MYFCQIATSLEPNSCVATQACTCVGRLCGVTGALPPRVAGQRFPGAPSSSSQPASKLYTPPIELLRFKPYRTRAKNSTPKFDKQVSLFCTIQFSSLKNMKCILLHKKENKEMADKFEKAPLIQIVVLQAFYFLTHI